MKEKQESPRRRCLLILIEKIPNAMKLTFLFLVISLLSFTATASAQRVSIVLDNAKVEKVLATITHQTGLSVAYSKQIVDLNRRVSVNFTNAELTNVLDKITEGTSLSYEVKNGKIYLFEKTIANAVTQQAKKITGVVVDSKGEPIIGANVVEKGTTNGTITDFDGKFILEVSDNATLQFSYIGFMPTTVAIAGQTSLNVRLREDTQALEEVVVVGYGTQKKVNLTGSVSSVKFDEELANRPITDASQALSGKVSGVWISQNSGKPGDDGAQLRIRGWGTLNNSDPLVIIDGVEGVFSQVNPSDIESITVLKDAASAAIYGSKAANGVVLVTTKMGKNNEKTQVELNSYVGMQQIGRHFDLVTNSAEHMTMANQALVNGGENPLFSETLISNFANGTDPYKYPNTDWYDNPYFEAYEKIKSINNFTTNGSLSFKYEILPWLKLQLRAGGVAYANNNVTRSSVGTISKGRGGWEDGALGYYKEGKKTGFTMNYDFFLLFNKKLSDFSVDGLLGGSLYYTKTKNLEASTKNGLSVPGFYSIKASVESPIVDAETKTKKVNSLFGTLTLGYKDTYYLEATGRNDWSSTLPSNDKSYFYPSVGVSIIPSNIISLPDWIPFWKLRGSWTVSKTDLAIYDLDRAYTIRQNVWDGLNTASYPDYLRGDVKPITNRTWEIGTGIHFLQGHRLKLDVSYFNKLTYNNTISQRISSATGYKSRLMNIDEEYVRRGVEISIDATPVQVRDFSWDVSLNLSTSKRYYAKLDESFSPDNLWTYVGARTDSYSYKGYDKDPDGNYIINTNGLMSRSQYSSLIGYTDPDLEYGLANVFKYKNFTLTLNFDGRIGGKSWSNTEFHMLETGAHPDTDNQWRYDEVVNGKKNYVGEGVKIVSGEVKYDQYGRITSDTRVFAPNDIETSYEDFVRSSHNNPDKLVQKKTFLKLREMSIGYNLPKKFISKLSMNSCYVGFIGQNLFVLTKDFRFSDPDGFEDIEGEDISSPSIRYVGVNLKVEF